jgi:hypothetical protein
MQSQCARYTADAVLIAGVAVKLFTAANLRTTANPNLFNKLLSKGSGRLGIYGRRALRIELRISDKYMPSVSSWGLARKEFSKHNM